MAFISWMNGEGGRTCCDTTSMMKQRGKYSLGVRLSIVVVAVAWVLNKKTIKSRLLPFGSPTKTKERPTFAAVDPSNDSLRLKRKIIVCYSALFLLLFTWQWQCLTFNISISCLAFRRKAEENIRTHRRWFLPRKIAKGTRNHFLWSWWKHVHYQSRRKFDTSYWHSTYRYWPRIHGKHNIGRRCGGWPTLGCNIYARWIDYLYEWYGSRAYPYSESTWPIVEGRISCIKRCGRQWGQDQD